LIALILKNQVATSFQEFRPICLCNISFKIISKIIAGRIKDTLSRFLSKDQHGFLKGRNILDVVANTQEGLFFMHINKSEAVILKIDLRKAYDCLEWGFMRFLLAKIGLNSNMIRWIMACMENVNYDVIINGMPSSYFLAARGLRQGCSLSPLLFILAMDALSLQMNKAVLEGCCHPLKICRDNFISHNLFVDDILIFGMLCKLTWTCLHDILVRFQKATGLHINESKSSFFHNDANMDLIDFLSSLFGIGARSIKDGMKYLGFQLKACSYSKSDWLWILDRYYKRISRWEFKILTMAGRVVLAQLVLVQLAGYWAHLFYIPASIIHMLNRLTANFIWGGQSEKRKYHLTKLSDISLPKKLGG